MGRIKSLIGTGGDGRLDEVEHLMTVLRRDFVQSNQANYRKGGLIGLAAAALGLDNDAHRLLHHLLPPILSCFTDQDNRVRYYACEALYNVAKVTRTRLLAYFNQIFDALCRISTDLDPGIKNGAQLLDRLLKDIVAESTAFALDSFVPLLRQHLECSSSCLHHLLIGWIVTLEAMPHINLRLHLKDLLVGIFGMLSDSDAEIRQQADQALAQFHIVLQASVHKQDWELMGVLLQCAHLPDAPHPQQSCPPRAGGHEGVAPYFGGASTSARSTAGTDSTDRRTNTRRYMCVLILLYVCSHTTI